MKIFIYVLLGLFFIAHSYAAIETIFSPVPSETMNLILQLNARKDIRAFLRLLLLWVHFGSFWISANGDSVSPWQDGALKVAEFTRHAYGLRDDTGRTMDGLQVIATKPLVL